MPTSAPFVDNDTSLPATKSDFTTSVAPTTEKIAATDWNTTANAVYDIRTVLYRSPSIYYFGGVGDGATDVEPALVAAATALGGQPGIVAIPPGSFKLSTNFTVPKGMVLDFQGGTITVANGVQLLINEPIRAPQGQQIFFYTTGYTVTPVQFNTPSGAPDPVYMTWFGLLSGLHLSGTNNPAAFKACVDSLANPTPNVDPNVTTAGGRIVIPLGDYTFPGTMQMLGAGYSGITIEGQTWGPEGNSGVNFNFTQTDGSPCQLIGGSVVGDTSGPLSRCVFRNLACQQGPQAGPFCLGVLNDTPAVSQPNSGTGTGLSTTLFDQCTWNCLNGSVVGMKKRFSNCEFRNCLWVGSAGRSKPVIYCDGGQDQFASAPTVSMGQSEKNMYTGITQWDQGFNVSTPETAYFAVYEAWGVAELGVGNFTFEMLRAEQVHSGTVLLSGANFFTFYNLGFEDQGATALIQPDFQCTYNNNDSSLHLSNSITIIGGFGQCVDSSSIPQLLFTGNPGGSSGGWVIQGSVFEHCKATNGTVVSIDSNLLQASGSTNIVTIGSAISGIEGISSGPTQPHNLCGTVTVTSGSSEAVVLFGSGESNGDYRIILGSPHGIATTIIAPSGGQSFPQSTVHVADTTGWPSSGNAALQTTGGIFEIAYTGKTSTSLTTVTGGSGTMTNGDKIVNVPAVSAQLRVANVSTFPAGFIIDLETTTAQDLTFNWVMARDN